MQESHFFLPSSQYALLPQKPGVYIYHDAVGEVIYVGKAKQLKNRVSSYFQNPSKLLGKTALLVPQIVTIEIYVVDSELEALLLEANFIKKFTPKYNIQMKDGKNYALIRIITKGQVPVVLYARKMEDKNSVYFGPYPSSTSVRAVLRILRRIFPFQSVLHHDKRPCLYHHLGLCPCIPTYPDKLPEYKKNIHHIIQFLEGNTKKVMKELEVERNDASKIENFEKASELQRQINAIEYVTSPVHNPFEYEVNPNLRSDVREQEMKSLQDVLAKFGMTIDLPRRIECYDVSNLQMSNAVGAMTVLTDGEIDTSQYRKFKMHTKGPNDFAMHAEMMERRLGHPEWPLPDLFVIDGGKGQVGAVLPVLEKYLRLDDGRWKLEKEVGSLKVDNPAVNVQPLDLATNLKHLTSQIPVVGLAKREETIVLPDNREIKIPKSTPALQLIIRIRDEAHRFGITYHKKLRARNFLPKK